MNLRRLFAVTALAATGLAAGGLALDRLFPPDLARYHERSSETVDANGRLLRAYVGEITDGCCLRVDSHCP